MIFTVSVAMGLFYCFKPKTSPSKINVVHIFSRYVEKQEPQEQESLLRDDAHLKVDWFILLITYR